MTRLCAPVRFTDNLPLWPSWTGIARLVRAPDRQGHGSTFQTLYPPRGDPARIVRRGPAGAGRRDGLAHPRRTTGIAPRSAVRAGVGAGRIRRGDADRDDRRRSLRRRRDPVAALCRCAAAGGDLAGHHRPVFHRLAAKRLAFLAVNPRVQHDQRRDHADGQPHCHRWFPGCERIPPPRAGAGRRAARRSAAPSGRTPGIGVRDGRLYPDERPETGGRGGDQSQRDPQSDPVRRESGSQRSGAGAGRAAHCVALEGPAANQDHRGPRQRFLELS